MPLKNIAVKGCRLRTKHGDPTTETIEITQQESTLVKCDGKAAYIKMSFTVSGYKGGAIERDGQGQGEIKASSIYCKIENMPAFLEGDESDGGGTETDISIWGPNPAGTIVEEKDTVYIDYAGQSKCKGM